MQIACQLSLFNKASTCVCTESLDDFSPADALHVKYPLSPITIYATKPEVKQYKDRLDFINITEIGEAQAMMEMVDTSTSEIYRISAQIS